MHFSLSRAARAIESVQFVVIQVLQSGLFTKDATEYLPYHVAVLEPNENFIAQ